MKIVLCGPPHTGKSCLREGLKQAIRDTPDAPYPYIITACPDGEGAWFQETVSRSSEDARHLKDEYKKSLDGFSPEFIKMASDAIKNCILPLTLIDIGGRPDEKNKEICRHATHAIILFNESDKVDEWRQFCHELGIKIIAEIYSDYHGKEDSAEVKDGILKGTVHHLERGEDISKRYCVTALANYLITNREKSMTTYNINIEKDKKGDTLLRLSFGKSALNDQIVRDAIKRLSELDISGGELVKLNGPASLPVAIAIAHHIMHKFSYIGVYDPKLDKYVIVVAHGPVHKIGDLIGFGTIFNYTPFVAI